MFWCRCTSSVVGYHHPDHPRHTFPEDWDSSDHPRFYLGSIMNCIERLTEKGYTVHADSGVVRIRKESGEVVLEMRSP